MTSHITHEEKALEIIRLIFHGGLSRDKQEAVKQVAAIIQRGVKKGANMTKLECILLCAMNNISSTLIGPDYRRERIASATVTAQEALQQIKEPEQYLCCCGYGCHEDENFDFVNGQLVQKVGL